jgi:hypothetical protein
LSPSGIASATGEAHSEQNFIGSRKNDISFTLHRLRALRRNWKVGKKGRAPDFARCYRVSAMD